MRNARYILMLVCLFPVFLSACGSRAVSNANVDAPTASLPPATPQPTAVPTPAIPNLQADLTDDRNKTTTSPIGKFDFQNHSYQLPRGWENPDGSDSKLVNGRLAPIGVSVNGKMSYAEKADPKSGRRIGLSYVSTKFLDVTGDGVDEALVVLKVETGGSAIPQIVYVFNWKDGKPDLIWIFRTGDRADGGLKDLRAEHGLFVVELYGQDRFLLGQTETGKITGDVEQLCCPTHFTRTVYKWNGKNFLMQGKRLSFRTADPNAAPVENMGDTSNAKPKPRK